MTMTFPDGEIFDEDEERAEVERMKQLLMRFFDFRKENDELFSVAATYKLIGAALIPVRGLVTLHQLQHHLIDIVNEVEDTLMNMDHDPNQPTPLIAEEWVYSDDPETRYEMLRDLRRTEMEGLPDTIDFDN